MQTESEMPTGENAVDKGKLKISVTSEITAYPVEAFLGRKCFVYNSGQLFRIISYLLTVCQFG